MDASGLRRALPAFVAAVMALIGLGLLAYPHLSFLIADTEQTYVIQSHNDLLRKAKEDEIEAEWQRAESYNASLGTSVLYDPFATGTDTMDEAYRNVLDIGGDGVMGYIEIPKISVSIPIYHGVAASTLEKGVGHLEGSSLPIGGRDTHAILTGHTGLNTAKLFTDLDKMGLEDEFYLYILGEALAYKVVSVKVAEPQDVSSLTSSQGKDLVTLITCTPYGINSHRLLVQGERTAYDPEKAVHAEVAVPWGTYAAGAVALAALIMFAIFAWRKTKRPIR